MRAEIRGEEKEKRVHTGGWGSQVKRMGVEEVAEVRARAEDQGWKFERD